MFRAGWSTWRWRSGGAWHEPRGLPAARSPDFWRHGTVGRDHAPGAVERAFAQFEAEQPIAFEWARQRQLAGPGRREAEAGIIRRVAEQNHRAMAASFGGLKR